MEKLLVRKNPINFLKVHKNDVVFTEGLGTFTGTKFSLQVDPQANPKFFKARIIPSFLKDKVDAKLARLQSLGIITPVKHSSWGALVDPILKQNGTIRLCDNYRTTINTASEGDTCCLSRVEGLFVAIAGGKVFSKLICVRHICDWLWKNLPLTHKDKY